MRRFCAEPQQIELSVAHFPWVQLRTPSRFLRNIEIIVIFSATGAADDGYTAFSGDLIRCLP
jgi:hypothetical protein